MAPPASTPGITGAGNESSGASRRRACWWYRYLRDTVDTQPLQPIPVAGLAQLSGLLNIETVPALGLGSVAAIDCRGQRAPGAAFSNNLGGRRIGTRNVLPRAGWLTVVRVRPSALPFD
jgi:hypothetical protein